LVIELCGFGGMILLCYSYCLCFFVVICTSVGVHFSFTSSQMREKPNFSNKVNN
jgi:hypothetical protein